MTLTREELTEAIDGSNARLVIIDPLQAFLLNGTSMGNMAQIFFTAELLQNGALPVTEVGNICQKESVPKQHNGHVSV